MASRTQALYHELKEIRSHVEVVFHKNDAVEALLAIEDMVKGKVEMPASRRPHHPGRAGARTSSET